MRKYIKIILTIIMINIMILGIIPNIVKATDSSERRMAISYHRYIKNGTTFKLSGENEKGIGYAIRGEHPLYQKYIH